MIIVSLACLFEILSVVVCLHYLYGEKIHVDWITVCFVLFDVFWMDLVYFESLGQAWSLVMYPVVMLYCGFKFGFKVKPIFVNNILNVIIMGILQATIMLIYGIVFDIQKTGIKDNLVINILMFLITIVAIRKINMRKLSNILQSNDVLILKTFAIIVISVAILLVSYKQNKGFNLTFYILLTVSIILIVITSIDIGKHKIKAKEAEAELRLHKLYESSFKELIDEICARQHEFDNHISTIYSQHQIYKTYDTLVAAQKQYCHEVVEENHFNKILSKGNPVILSFLYSKLSEMNKLGICVTYKISIGNLECGIPIYKLVELLGNLIKNAIEAETIRMKKNIHIMIIENTERIQIEILNESEEIEKKRIEDFFKKGYSEKGKRRGYGLYNVKRICEEYGAAIICKNEQRENMNWLMFKIIINKPL